MLEYIYVDLETTVNGGPDEDSPEAHWLNNKVLLCGFTWGTLIVEVLPTTHNLGRITQKMISSGKTPVIVAHNAKFDLKYLMRDNPGVEWDKVKVWDTMTWHYRMTGHLSKTIGLEKLTKEYGIPFKKSLDLGALLDAGLKMEDIDTQQLTDYLIDDVQVLKEVHLKQLNYGLTFDMDYLLPLCEMELNGMQVDRDRAQELFSDLADEVRGYQQTFIEHITQQCEWQDGTPLISDDFTDVLGTKSKYIKPLASRTLSFLLTGSPKHLQITPKWSVHYKPAFTPYYRGTLPPYFVSNSMTLGYSVDEGVLEQDTSWIAVQALHYRKANKLLGTYIGPMLHTSQVQGTIHPRLNTAVTGTGRLSSSQPNGQNMSEIARELVIPRPSIEIHNIVELDFSQLELVAVACISRDMNLLYDLQHGVDIHHNTASKVFGKANALAMRKIAKNVNFGLLYGGKAAGLSIQTGVDKAKVQQLIDAFYIKYPRVAIWQKQVFDEIVDNMEAYDVKDGEQRYSSIYTEPVSGRTFTFLEQKSPPWLRHKTGRRWSFSPQQTSNYPIQGFAGGDIVMDALTRIWRVLRKHVDFIMTVHDSIIMDTQMCRDELESAIDPVLKETKKKFNLSIDLTYDLEIGPTWK